MSRPFRHISLRELVTLVANDLAVPEAELVEDEFLWAAKAAVDAPATRKQDRRGVRGRELYPTMPRRFAALVSQLLTDAPLADYPARVATTIGDELLRRGRARWTVDPTKTRLLFEQWARNPDEIDLDFLVSGVGPLGGPRVDPQLEKLFPARGPDVVRIYLAGPLHALQEAGKLGIISTVHEACEDALRSLERALGWPIEFRLIQPSFDDAEIDDDECWEWDLGRLEQEADALVVADLGRFQISFGVACEIARFRQLPGALAHLSSASDDRAHAQFFQGLVHEVSMEPVPCRGPEDVPRHLIAWVSRTLGQLMDAARRRDDVIVLATPRHRQLVTRWDRLSQQRRAVIRDGADISPARMSRVLESPAAFAALPHHCAEHLIHVIDPALFRPPNWPTDVHWDNLLAAARDGRWSADEISRVAHEARRRIDSLRVAATRPQQSVVSYEQVHRELFGW